jgi:hypothetical protein
VPPPDPATPPAATQQQPPATPPQGGDTDWKARYDTLEGKYRAEVPRLATEIKFLKVQLEETTQKIATLSATQAPPASGNDDGITSDDKVRQAMKTLREEFPEIAGPLETLFNASQRKNPPPAQPVVDEDRFVRLEKTVLGSARERYQTDLKKSVPDLEVVDAHPDFLLWLTYPDLLSGRIRQDLLDEANAELNAVRVANIFNAWKAELGYVAPQPPPSLDTQIAPPTSGGAPGAPMKPTFTLADYQRHQMEFTKGDWRGREDEWHRIDREMMVANSEGRLTR